MRMEGGQRDAIKPLQSPPPRLLGYKEASVQVSGGAPPQAVLCSIPIPPFWSYHGDVGSGSHRCLTCTGEDGGTTNTRLSLQHASGGSSEGRPRAAAAGAVTDVLWSVKANTGRWGGVRVGQ